MMEKHNDSQRGYMNPYLAGVILGLALLASLVFLGAGLGASGGIARVGAFLEGCVVSTTSEYFKSWGDKPLQYYLVFMLGGIFLGGLLSAFTFNRIEIKLERGKSCSRFWRIILALIGGILSGFASRLAQGCTSGQALTGGSLLLTGSMVFMLCVFAGGYLAAFFVRRQWHD